LQRHRPPPDTQPEDAAPLPEARSRGPHPVPASAPLAATWSSGCWLECAWRVRVPTARNPFNEVHAFLFAAAAVIFGAIFLYPMIRAEICRRKCDLCGAD